MKRRLALIVAMLVLALSVVACGGNDTENTGNEDANVVTENEEAGTAEEEEADEEEDEAELTGELTWDLPEGFAQTSEENGYIYYTHVENVSAANINYITMENDGSLPLITSDMFVQQIQTEYANSGYGDVAITVESESKEPIDGRQAYTYEMSYTLNGTEIHQIQTIVEDGDEYVFFTFSWFGYEEGYEDGMRASAASIRFE